VTKSSSDSTSSTTELYSSETSRVKSDRVYLNSATISDGNFIDAKQFYSSDNGNLYSSDTNYLRHNLNKRRFR
jgi:hypothetical protein